MEYLLASIVGIGLAAACGLRAFLPVLGLSLAARAGWVSLGPSFEWLGTWPAIAALGVATVAEVGSSITPIVAHALDAIAAPVAFAAGAVVMACQFGGTAAAGMAGVPDVSHTHPLLEWAAVAIAATIWFVRRRANARRVQLA